MSDLAHVVGFDTCPSCTHKHVWQQSVRLTSAASMRGTCYRQLESKRRPAEELVSA